MPRQPCLHELAWLSRSGFLQNGASLRESPPQGVTIVAAFLLIQEEIPGLCVARHFNAGMRFTE